MPDKLDLRIEQMGDPWYPTEQEWYEAQSPEAQAEYDAWVRFEAFEMPERVFDPACVLETCVSLCGTCEETIKREDAT